MKNIKLILALLLASTVNTYAQDFEVPVDYKFNTPADYAKSEQDIIAAVDWMIATPISESTNKRRLTYAFFLVWITGSPNATVVISNDVIPFSDVSDYLIVFMGGWTKHALESKDEITELQGNIAGINAVITFYEKNKEVLGKNKHVEKYIKLKKKGKMEATVESRMA
ncbi:MAG: hypothetical protein GQ574_16595 [Crocinitomix sp.]|nr:hypothetical protein [Crocinitomix sp.]